MSVVLITETLILTAKGSSAEIIIYQKYQHLKYKNTLEIRSPEADEPSPL